MFGNANKKAWADYDAQKLKKENGMEDAITHDEPMTLDNEAEVTTENAKPLTVMAQLAELRRRMKALESKIGQ